MIRANAGCLVQMERVGLPLRGEQLWSLTVGNEEQGAVFEISSLVLLKLKALWQAWSTASGVIG